MPILAAYLFPALKRRFGDLRVLKKVNLYFSVRSGQVHFKDALLFTSPTSLSKYLKQNNIQEEKSIFPHGRFNSISQIKAQVDFPKYEEFYSSLKNQNVPREDYDLAKAEFYRRKNLPSDHPEKINSFKDWLVFYNNLDVLPLAKAINNSFSTFFEIFSIDPEWCISLPKYSQMCMFRNYDQNESFCYSFFHKNEDIYKVFRNSLYGGLVNCFHRCIDLSGRPNLPKSAQYAPDGNIFTNISFFDFNSLYLYAQLLPFPSTPGIEWKLKENYFVKKIMAPGCSFEGLQWLIFENQTSPKLLSTNGSRVKIQHKYFQGEFEFMGYQIDGYAKVDGKMYFWEYLGCYWHECEKCGSEGKPGSGDRWRRKKLILQQHGHLTIMHGCFWKKKLKYIKNRETPKFPQILKTFGTEKNILIGLQKETLFGFIIADVSTPPHILEKINYLNFPPIIVRGEITPDMLSPYMAKRCKDKKTKFPQNTLLQRYHAEQILIYAPMAKFYLDLGLEIKNISSFIQYQPVCPLKPFVQKITDGRINSVKNHQKSLEFAFKVIGNS